VAEQLRVGVEGRDQYNESQRRRLARALRKADVYWLREPRWSQLAHDLAIVDVRLAVEKALAGQTTLVLEQWIDEGQFARQTDRVAFLIPDADGRARPAQKGVQPDGYFVVCDRARQRQGLPPRARFLLALDHATHDNAALPAKRCWPAPPISGARPSRRDLESTPAAGWS
jgi:hypothetical protein